MPEGNTAGTSRAAHTFGRIVRRTFAASPGTDTGAAAGPYELHRTDSSASAADTYRVYDSVHFGNKDGSVEAWAALAYPLAQMEFHLVTLGLVQQLASSQPAFLLTDVQIMHILAGTAMLKSPESSSADDFVLAVAADSDSVGLHFAVGGFGVALELGVGMERDACHRDL